MGRTPLERRRAYRYGGEVAVDRDVVYGRNAVAEVLRAGRRKARRLLLAEGSEDHKTASEIASLAASRGVEVEYLSRTELERRAPGVNHQGAVLEVGQYPYVAYEELLAATRDNPNALLLVLDSLQDPQNLGTLLRTAEAAGVTGVIIPEHRAVQVTPAVVNASSGAVEHLPVAVVTNLVRAVEQAKEAGAWAVAAEAVPEAIVPSEADFTGPIILVVGSEGQGVGRLLRETCDLTVRIPLVGKVGSLNAATAGFDPPLRSRPPAHRGCLDVRPCLLLQRGGRVLNREGAKDTTEGKEKAEYCDLADQWPRFRNLLISLSSSRPSRLRG